MGGIVARPQGSPQGAARVWCWRGGEFGCKSRCGRTEPSRSFMGITPGFTFVFLAPRGEMGPGRCWGSRRCWLRFGERRGCSACNKFLLRSWQREPEHLQELRRCCRARPHPMLYPTGSPYRHGSGPVSLSSLLFCPPEPGVGSKRRRETPNVTLVPSCSVKVVRRGSGPSPLSCSEKLGAACNPTITKRPGAEERVRRKSKCKKKIKTVCRSRGSWR